MADLRATGWTVAHCREVVANLRAVADKFSDGGIVIEVPAGQPVIRTRVQLDGDIVTMVDPRIFDNHSPEELSGLIEQHHAALLAGLVVVNPRLAEGLAGLLRLARQGSYAIPVVTSAGFATGDITMYAIVAFAPYLAAAFIPLVVRFAAPRLVRRLLRDGIPRWWRRR